MPPKKDNAKGGGSKDKGGKAGGSEDKGTFFYRLIQSAYGNVFISSDFL